MTRALLFVITAFAMTNAGFTPCLAALPQPVQEAIIWYDTLGYPNTRDLPYVRVATGLPIKRGNQPFENTFSEGFLAAEDADSFTVFVCSISDFKDRFEMWSEPHAPLTTVRFVRRATGESHNRVEYEVLDFEKVAADAVARVSLAAADPTYGLRWGRPLSHRARIFAFARACLQRGLSETASKLMNFAANIPDNQTGEVDPNAFRDTLQQQIGDAVLSKTEADCGNPAISWADLLKAYDNFELRFPASNRIAYARESADLLRGMIAEDQAHYPKPLEEMSPDEQVTENIFQLKNLHVFMWIMNSHYPVVGRTGPGPGVMTPVHTLVDLGDAAVPRLIDALDDRRFTRCFVPSFKMQTPPKVMRVGDVAQRILEHISGQNFYPRMSDDGKVTRTTRQQAEAWWTEVQSKGEKQQLIEATALGDTAAANTARKLVQKYPDAALDAIKVGMSHAADVSVSRQMVEAAAGLPGNSPVAFLRSNLDAASGIYARLAAAEALFARGQMDSVTAIIDAWTRIQPRLPANDSDAYHEAGYIISFLAKSKDARAIRALAQNYECTPVDVRLALVKVFLPYAGSSSESSTGPTVHVNAEIAELPLGEAGSVIERLIVNALSDTERRFALKGTYGDVGYEDPRICDVAALVLSKRWPQKYPFAWSATSMENDAQIAKMRDRWRLENGLPAVKNAPPIAVPIARESDVAPLLNAYAVAGVAAAREKIAARIAALYGAGALAAVRARYEASKNDIYRPLAIDLASRIREVRVDADAGGAAKLGVAALKGQRLDGERLAKLATDFQAALPPTVRSVSFFAERAGNGTGFSVTIGFVLGQVNGQTGWDRELSVRDGEKNLYNHGGYVSEGGMQTEAIYRGMKEAFEKAIQLQLDSPVIVRFRLQRAGIP
jgi:hypothetical protein